MRRLLLIGAVSVIVLSGYWWGPAAWDQAQALHYERQCMAYVAPVDQVVYDEAEARAEVLLAGGGMVRLRPTGPAVAIRTVPGWDKFYPLVEWHVFYKGSGAVLFLHSRRYAGGESQLVAVEYAGQSGDNISFSTYTPRPAGLLKPAANRSGGTTLLIPTSDARKPFRFFAGQPDPGDDSHFTIEYEIGGQRGTIDGWLRAEQRVDLQIRDGPAKR